MDAINNKLGTQLSGIVLLKLKKSIKNMNYLLSDCKRFFHLKMLESTEASTVLA
jgi:hypothetical protein